MVYHLRKVPGCAVVLLFSLLDPTLQPAVGEGVVLVKVQIALISEEAISSTWLNTLDVFGCDQGGRKVDEMLSSRLELKSMFSHHWELVWGSNKKAERTVALVNGAKGHCVRVQIQCKTQSVLSTCSQFYLLCLALP